MKTILWIQRKSTDEDDIISVDGMRVDKEAPTYQNTYDKLNDDKFVRIYKSDDLQIFKHTSKKQTRYICLFIPASTKRMQAIGMSHLWLVVMT